MPSGPADHPRTIVGGVTAYCGLAPARVASICALVAVVCRPPVAAALKLALGRANFLSPLVTTTLVGPSAPVVEPAIVPTTAPEGSLTSEPTFRSRATLAEDGVPAAPASAAVVPAVPAVPVAPVEAAAPVAGLAGVAGDACVPVDGEAGVAG